MPVNRGDAGNQLREVTNDVLRQLQNETECRYLIFTTGMQKLCVPIKRGTLAYVHFSHLDCLRVPVYRGYMYRCVSNQDASLQRPHTVYTRDS